MVVQFQISFHIHLLNFSAYVFLDNSFKKLKTWVCTLLWVALIVINTVQVIGIIWKNIYFSLLYLKGLLSITSHPLMLSEWINYHVLGKFQLNFFLSFISVFLKNEITNMNCQSCGGCVYVLFFFVLCKV